MNNTTKMLLPVTALCIYCSGCVAYERPVYHRTPTYVTEPAYVTPVTYSTTTYVAEPIYIDGGHRHHRAGRIPPHSKHRSVPKHPPRSTHKSTPTPQKAPIHAHSSQKAAVSSTHTPKKAVPHSKAKPTLKPTAKAIKHRK